jgi:hypothetical protein
METLQPEQSPKDQLLTKDKFVYYCRTAGVHDTLHLLRNLDENFLLALQKDSLISPIFEDVEDGSGRSVSYYSRFQIFIPLALSENIVDSEGDLRDPENMEWQLEQGSRYMRWRKTAFLHLNQASSVGSSYLEVCKKFHQFLLLILTLKIHDRHEDPHKARLYTDLPPLSYDFSPITEESLSAFSLNVNDLKQLRLQIGFCGREIDPLKAWGEYVDKHPQKKKDLLLGEAALAQRCYEICDLITSVLEVVTGEKPRSLTHYLNSGGPLPSRGEYVQGVDTWALLATIERFNEWAGKPEIQALLKPEELQKVQAVKIELDDYITRYGQKSWPGNHISFSPDPKVTLESLDEDSRHWLENFRKQSEAQGVDFHEPSEIAHIVYTRLSDIQRSLRSALSEIQNKFRDESSKIWEKEERYDVWSIYWSELSKMSKKEQIVFTQNKRKEIQERRERWDNLSKDLWVQAYRFCDIAFCRVCHENPIEVHVSDNDRKSTSIFGSVICDGCKASATDIHRIEDLPAGLNCWNCGKLIYRYVHDNHFFSEEKAQLSREEIKQIQKEEGVRGSVARFHKQSIHIPYGKVDCTVMCGYCGTSNVYNLEYGWRE